MEHRKIKWTNKQITRHRQRWRWSSGQLVPFYLDNTSLNLIESTVFEQRQCSNRWKEVEDGPFFHKTFNEMKIWRLLTTFSKQNIPKWLQRIEVYVNREGKSWKHTRATRKKSLRTIGACLLRLDRKLSNALTQICSRFLFFIFLSPCCPWNE